MPHVEGGIMDRDIALARLGGDADLLKQLAVLFLADYPSVISDLRAAMERGDVLCVERAASILKGSLNIFVASAAIDAAARVEFLVRAQKLTEVPAAVASLEEVLAALSVELKGLNRETSPT